MRFRDLGRWIVGSLVLIAAAAATTYASAIQVPEPDPSTLTVAGLMVGGYLVGILKFRKK